MSTGSSANNSLTDFPYVCRYCGKSSFRKKIELLDHKWKNHQDEIRQVNPKPVLNHDLIDDVQFDKYQHQAEEKGKNAKESSNISESPVYSQIKDEVIEVADEKKDQEEEEYENYSDGNHLMEAVDTIDASSDEEIDIQEEQFFQCSNCGSNFLTLNNLITHESECGNEIQNCNPNQIQASDLFSHQHDTKVQNNTITLPTAGSSRRKSIHEKRLFEYDEDEGKFISLKKKRDRKSSIPVVNVESIASVQPESSHQEECKNRRKSRQEEQLFECDDKDEVHKLSWTKKRPPLTYNCLIALAIKNSSTQTVTSYQVFKFTAQVFPYFKYDVNQSLKWSIYHTLCRSTLFKKIKIINHEEGKRTKFAYEFDSDPVSKNRIESLIRNECLNQQVAIKNCMRRPEDFSGLVKGFFSSPLETVESSCQSPIKINFDDDVNQVEQKEKNQTRKRGRKKSGQTRQKLKESPKVQLQSKYKRPNLTYNCLIALATKNSSTQTVTAQQVRKFVTKVFPFFEYAVNNNWKKSLRVALCRTPFLKKSKIDNHRLRRTVYRLDLEIKSQEMVKNLVQHQCLNNEEAIKSCMRRPEDFSRMVTGDLCMSVTDTENEEAEDEPVSKKPKATTFKDYEFLTDPLETVTSQQSPMINYLGDDVNQVGNDDVKCVPVQIQTSFKRPKLTFKCLIALAIKNSPSQTMTPHDMLKFVAEVFPYFQDVVNPNWKSNLRVVLWQSPLFKKINNNKSSDRRKRTLFYGFDSDSTSKLRIESLIIKECLNKEAEIKSCMRRPEDFSRMVSGDLRLRMAEEDGEDDKENEENKDYLSQ